MKRMKTINKELQGVKTNDIERQWMTASSTTNENDTEHFKEWMTAIKHRNRHTIISRDGWLQLE